MWSIVTPEDMLATAVICVLIALVGAWQAHRLGLRRDIALFFTISALALSLVRYTIEVSTPADAVGYYLNSLLWAEFDVGTEFISYLTSYLTGTLDLGFLPSMMFFTLFGLMALQLFYATYLRIGGGTLGIRWHLGFLMLMVPSVGFWGSGISKDSLVLFGLAIFCWGILKTKRSPLTYGLGIAIVTMVRPHIGVVMLLSLGIAMIFGRGVRTLERSAVIGFGILAAILVVPLAIEYVGLGNISSLDDVSYRLETWSRGYEDTDAFIDIANMPLPLQLITYLFRPFPWEQTTLVQLMASLQNMILLIMLAVGVPRLFRRGGGLRELPQLTFLIYSVGGLLLLAVTTANLGIAVRQKWMVMIPMLLALTHALVRAKQQAEAKRAARSADAAAPPILAPGAEPGLP